MERRDTRRRFEQWAHNPLCEANAISAIMGVSMADVAKRENLRPSMGQSPFALQRGERFERQLFRNNAEVMREQLVAAEVLLPEATGFRDLRMRQLGGTSRNLDEAQDRTLRLLGELASSGLRRATPNLVAGATICVPGRAMLPEAILVLDALVIRAKGKLAELVVGEVKTYPDRGGFTDRSELAGARAQLGVYVHGLEQVIADKGWIDRLSVAKLGFLALTKPGSNRSSIRVREDLRYQADRAARGLASLRDIASKMAPEGTPPEDPISTVIAAPMHYEEACIRFCDRASGCFAHALANGDPSVLGDDVARLLGTMTLPRVRELLHGAKPKSRREQELVELARGGGGKR